MVLLIMLVDCCILCVACFDLDCYDCGFVTSLLVWFIILCCFFYVVGFLFVDLIACCVRLVLMVCVVIMVIGFGCVVGICWCLGFGLTRCFTLFDDLIDCLVVVLLLAWRLVVFAYFVCCDCCLICRFVYCLFCFI